ncbi:MAG TPA: indole-3-glycerol phosphate synthase TrpC, partial [Chloroflexota bacterium]|nr:indole-3-glycerol phosphate synthase TrpC [Chloroflexota bacterium]
MILDDIVAHKWEELALRKAERSLKTVKETATSAPAPRGFGAALRTNGLSIVAEVKRKSPAKGVLNQTVVPADQASAYARAGASAISVLTDQRFFDGDNADLQAVRECVTRPVLRKDFTVDEYQVWEARSIGADAILLIV